MENTKRTLKGCLWVLTMKFDDLMQLLSAEHSIDREADCQEAGQQDRHSYKGFHRGALFKKKKKKGKTKNKAVHFDENMLGIEVTQSMVKKRFSKIL